MKIAYNKELGGFALSYEVIKYLQQKGIDVDDNGFMNEGHIDNVIKRHDPLLIEALEKYPDDDIGIFETNCDRYYIEEYDGSEIVWTPENIPWIIVNQENRICGNCKYSDGEPFCQFCGEISYNFTCEHWTKMDNNKNQEN